MTQIAKLPMPLQIPLMTLLMLALAGSTLLALTHYAPTPRAAYADTAQTPGTPYGSGAAIRNLLF